MEIKLYKTESEENRINKTLTLSLTLDGTMRNETTIESPKILVEFSSLTESAIFESNFAYIPEFDKYYFVGNEKNIVRQGLVELPLSVDPLMTYASELMNTEMLIERSEIYNQQYITDNLRMSYNFPMVLTREFGGSFSRTPRFYLTVAGGHGGESS